MKTIQINKYGGVEVLQLNNDAQKPLPAKNQMLVEIFGASINPFDIKVRQGYMKENMPHPLPVTLGSDFAGVVRELGQGVTFFKVGDEIYGSASIFNGGSGAFAEFAAVNEENSALKPKSIDFYQAAALPLVGSSAIQALEEHIKLKAGQQILIHGGAGGIGHIAIQLAKALGAYVATTASANGKNFVKNLGADEIIDYKKEDFTKKLKDFDAVYDTAGGKNTENSFSVLKPGGVLVSMLGEPSAEHAKMHGVTAIGQVTKVNTAHLKRLAELVDNKKIKIQISNIFPLEKMRQAAKQFESGHKQGKIVLSIK